MNRSLASLALLGALSACQKTPASTPASTTPATLAPAPQAPARTEYHVEPVVQGGTLRGRVRWEGERPAIPSLPVPPEANQAVCGTTQTVPVLEIGAEGGVQHTVLSLRGIERGKPAPGTTPVMDQRGCQYVPHVLAVMRGQTVRFGNTDTGILHNVHAHQGYRGTQSWFNRATPAGLGVTRSIEDEGVATIGCDAGHSWMLAFVHRFAHPYFAVTSETGEFEITDIPPGTWPLQFWHEGFTPGAADREGRPTFGPAIEHEHTVTIAPGASVTVNFVLGPTGVRIEP
jgi:plastocyanin